MKNEAAQGKGDPTRIAKLESCVDTLIKQALHKVPPEYFAEHCPPHATGLAQKVFNIPELLEMILENLDMNHLLGVMCLNRQFHDAVEYSPKFQKRLSLVPQEDFHLPLNQESLPRIFMDINNGETGSSGYPAWNQEVVVAEFFDTLPRLGPRCRRMLVANPPVKEMKAFVNCCPMRNGGVHVEARVRNEKGVTMGDLLDMATQLMRRHLHCAHASWAQHSDEDGTVKVNVSFEALITLRDADPRLHVPPAQAKRTRELAVGRKRREKLIKAFIMAKRAGRAQKVRVAVEG